MHLNGTISKNNHGQKNCVDQFLFVAISKQETVQRTVYTSIVQTRREKIIIINNNSNFVTLWNVKRSARSRLFSVFFIYTYQLYENWRNLSSFAANSFYGTLILSMHFVSDLYQTIWFNASPFQLNKIGSLFAACCSLCFATHYFYGLTEPKAKPSQTKPHYTKIS